VGISWLHFVAVVNFIIIADKLKEKHSILFKNAYLPVSCLTLATQNKTGPINV
jgi:hypothetical protein